MELMVIAGRPSGAAFRTYITQTRPGLWDYVPEWQTWISTEKMEAGDNRLPSNAMLGNNAYVIPVSRLTVPWGQDKGL